MKSKFDMIEEVIAVLALSIMTFLAFINVVARYIFSASLSFTDEMTTSLFVLLTLVGASIAAKRGAHLGLSIFVERMGVSAQKKLKVTANLLGILFTVVLFYYGVVMAYNEFKLEQLTAGMQLPEWIFGSFVPLGAALLLVRFIQQTKNALKEEVN
ncbi:TRAP transporter small permease [Anaerotalea alkaliphila]|uniref:TRAP transporter small permease n=1 Tax=Anaerotalea alkaliphila TaxID=2662126 RepID=A0A7X5KML8_9FIRM|nr:TRAP transporter small permease [Anaerotalea alkaliphila]NDL66858.1 TRAP transporter small permease [Anaerotalea alkaliphila]